MVSWSFRLSQKQRSHNPYSNYISWALTLISCNTPIHLQNFDSLTELNCKTSNSKISLENIHADHFLLHTSNSSIKVEDIAGGDVHAKTSNAKILLNKATFSNSIDLTTSNAPIEVHELCGTFIKLRTSNASIKGSICGSIVDYNITSSTSNASSTLPTHMNTGKDKELTAKTSNAKIHLTFEQDQQLIEQSVHCTTLFTILYYFYQCTLCHARAVCKAKLSSLRAAHRSHVVLFYVIG